MPFDIADIGDHPRIDGTFYMVRALVITAETSID